MHGHICMCVCVFFFCSWQRNNLDEIQKKKREVECRHNIHMEIRIVFFTMIVAAAAAVVVIFITMYPRKKLCPKIHTHRKIEETTTKTTTPTPTTVPATANCQPQSGFIM